MKAFVCILIALVFSFALNAQTHCASALVNGYKSGEHIRQEDLKNLNTLTIAVEGKSHADYTIVAFGTRFFIAGQAYASAEAGNILSAEAKTYLEKAQKGATLIFEDIKVKGPNGTFLMCPPVVLTVK